MIPAPSDEKLIAAMADELRHHTGLERGNAWFVAAGLLAGYRLGDPAAASGMAAAGEADCRRLVREALEAARGEPVAECFG